MERQPVALRKASLMAKWSPEDLARLLTRDFQGLSYILIAYEWVEDRPARTVSPSTLQAALAGLGKLPDVHSKIAMFPAQFFVWSDELEAAYQTYHHFVSSPDEPDELDLHGAFDMDPATHPFDDLLSDCPNFASNPYLTGGAELSKKDFNKQKTQAMHARWQARADELKKINPAMFTSDVAKRIAKEPIAEGRDAETIRRNISI